MPIPGMPAASNGVRVRDDTKRAAGVAIRECRETMDSLQAPRYPGNFRSFCGQPIWGVSLPAHCTRQHVSPRVQTTAHAAPPNRYSISPASVWRDSHRCRAPNRPAVAFTIRSIGWPAGGYDPGTEIIPMPGTSVALQAMAWNRVTPWKRSIVSTVSRPTVALSLANSRRLSRPL